MKKISTLLLILALLCIGMIASASAEALKVSTTFTKSTYEVNEFVEATYVISGGSGNYTSGTYTVYALKDGERVKLSSGTLNVSRKTGKITYKTYYNPGNKLFFEYTVCDTDGSQITTESQKVDLTEHPLEISTTFNKRGYNTGEEITAEYRITGETGIYASGDYYVYMSSNKYDEVIVDKGSLDLTGKKGTIKVTPKLQGKLHIWYRFGFNQ